MQLQVCLLEGGRGYVIEESERKDAKLLTDHTGRGHESRVERNVAMDTEKCKEIDLFQSFWRENSPTNALT